MLARYVVGLSFSQKKRIFFDIKCASKYIIFDYAWLHNWHSSCVPPSSRNMSEFNTIHLIFGCISSFARHLIIIYVWKQKNFLQIYNKWISIIIYYEISAHLYLILEFFNWNRIVSVFLILISGIFRADDFISISEEKINWLLRY